MNYITEKIENQSNSETKPFVPPVPVVQTKLEIGEVDDHYEKEADMIADQILQMKPFDADPPRPRKPAIQRKCSSCEEEERIRKKPLINQITPIIQRKGGKALAANVASEGISSKIAQSKGGGRPMDSNTRSIMESGFGSDFSNVRIHTGPSATELNNNLNAQAFTVGNDIFFNEGRYNPETNEGKHLLAHELTHTLQQTKPKIQRTGEFRERPPSANQASTHSLAGNDAMLEFFTGNSFRWLEVYNELNEANIDEYTDLSIYESAILSFLQYTAIGIMASHKQTIEGKRRSMFSNQPGQGRMQSFRDVAFNISQLEVAKEQLEEYKRNLNVIKNRAIFHRGDIAENLDEIGRNSNRIMPLDIRQDLVRRYQSVVARGSRDTMWLFIYGAASQMMELRNRQIQGMIASLSLLFENYPVFSELNPASVGSSRFSNDRRLEIAAQEAFGRVLFAIDDVVRGIHIGDKDPLDMPKVIQVARADLPEQLANYLDQMVSSHRQYQFWRDMGLTIAEILVAFIPVVGPALALGIGAASLAIQGERMMDQMDMAAVGANPYDQNPLGVQGPSTFERTMFGISGILTLVGAGSVFGSLRSGRLAGVLDEGVEAGVRRSGNLADEGTDGIRALDSADNGSIATRTGGDDVVRALDRTAEVEVPTLRHLEIEHDFIVANPENIRSIDETIGGVRYVEEIDLPNGHTWRRKPNGRWCRFSRRHCLSVEEQRSIGLDVEDLDSMQVRSTGRRGEVVDQPEQLRSNLGNPPSNHSGGWQAHHIIPYELRNHQIILYIRHRFGDQWNINDTLNGIFLPTRSNVPGAGNRSLHRGSHDFYSGVVETRLDEIRVRWIRDGMPDDQLLDEVMDLQIYYHGRLMRGEIPLARE